MNVHNISILHPSKMRSWAVENVLIPWVQNMYDNTLNIWNIFKAFVDTKCFMTRPNGKNRYENHEHYARLNLETLQFWYTLYNSPPLISVQPKIYFCDLYFWRKSFRWVSKNFAPIDFGPSQMMERIYWSL